MATTTINLPQLKSVTYTSPSQGLNAVEPMVVEFGNAAVWAKPFTLNVPALPTGVASFTVTRTSTKTSYAATGVIVSGGGNAQTVPVYYGDTLTVSATAAESYGDPTATLSQDTVTGDVTLTVTAGAYTPSWHTIVSSSISITNNSTSTPKTITVNGMRANTLTRATFSGSIVAYGFEDSTDTNIRCTASINRRTNEESENGVYTGSGHGSGATSGWNYGFNITMGNNSISFLPSSSGYYADECGNSWPMDFDGATVTITSVEQYY